MIHDHRPYWLKRADRLLEGWYTRRFVAPGFEALGPGYQMMKPWNVMTYGRHISAGRNLHVITDSHRKVAFSTWAVNDHQGHISIGNHVLVCPGCRFDSASSITVGDNCMFAAGVYVTDADWHDIYDRTEPVGLTRPVVLEDNVWIGDGAKVCKGTRIGKNSVIGAGSIVTTDIPGNVIAAGNPARVIRPLDPDRMLVTRETLFRDPAALAKQVDDIERYTMGGNSLLGWLRTRINPRRGD